MRIQHNIMAMNAYRNFNNNTSALSKNLEKLSSGYKINRAGDDAAGLAISEKMRAQISGLAQAQKNAKSGINLVQTAEGSLTEVHDMLNRMVTLAEQSANGTYDDGVDRANLQKEFDQLRSEIDRIADSSNFNGINLLDGSLQKGKDLTTTTAIDLPAVGGTLGVDTVLSESKAQSAKTTFDVDLGNLSFNKSANDTLVLQVGDTKFTLAAGELTGGASNTYTAKDIAAAFVTKYGAAAGSAGDVKFKSANGNDQAFTVTASGNKLTFEQTEVPGSKGSVVEGGMKVRAYAKGSIGGVTGSDGDTTVKLASHASNTAQMLNVDTDKLADLLDGMGIKSGDVKAFLKEGKEAGKYSMELRVGDKVIATAAAEKEMPESGGNISFSFFNADGGKLADVKLTDGTNSRINADDFKGGLDLGVDYMKGGGGKVSAARSATSDSTVATSAKIKYGKLDMNNIARAADALGIVANTPAAIKIQHNAVNDALDITINGKTVASASLTDFHTLEGVASGATNDGTLEFKDKDGNSMGVLELSGGSSNADHSITKAVLEGQFTGGGVGLTATYTSAPESGVQNGDWQPAISIIQQGGSSADARLASTNFELTHDMVKDNQTITLGNKTYTFKVGADSKVAAGAANVIDLSDMKGNEADFLATAAKKLTKTVNYDNDVWSSGGYDGAKITLLEKPDQMEADLSTLENIKGQISWSGAPKTSEGLTLQIGDTSDDFNQMTISVSDMHAAALGIADLSIADQPGAQAAVQTIKDAINSVSSTRGDLGAMQNRLDHTINNLSVMTENIQDAEATIRDTDVAEEMMAYTKNNILIQSAQAMLAQANQVPQGVLQLLQ